MAKFIKNIVDRLNLANRKGLSPFYSPDKICAEVHAESLNIWKKYVDEFERTQRISVYLEPLRGKETVALTSGTGTLVTAKNNYKTGVMIPTTDIQVTLIDIGHWSKRVNHSVRVADASNPICRIDNASIIVRPTSLTSVDVHFIKTPTVPVYAYTVSSDDYLYDDASSIDFEWNPILHDEIMNRVLENLGISQRENQVIQYSNLQQQKEGR